MRVGQERKDWIDPILYSEYLMHYILKIGEMVLVTFLMKKTIFFTAVSGSKYRRYKPI